MADPDFEPLHSGDEEDEFIQDKRRRDGGGKRQKNKSTPLFKRNVEKKEKGTFEPTRPIPAPSPGKNIQRPVQGLVGPGDTQFGVSPPTSPPEDATTFEGRSTKATSNNSKHSFGTNSTVSPSQGHWGASKLQEGEFTRQPVQHGHVRRAPNQPMQQQGVQQGPPPSVQQLPKQVGQLQQPQPMGQSAMIQPPVPQAQGQPSHQLPQPPLPGAAQQQHQPNVGPREDKLTLLAKAKLYSGAPPPGTGTYLPQERGGAGASQQSFNAKQENNVHGASQQTVTTPPRVASPVESGQTFSPTPAFSPPPNQQGTPENQGHWSAGESKSPRGPATENWADFSKTFGGSVDDLEDSDDQFRRHRSSSNSSAISSSSGEESDSEDSVWKITDEQRDYYTKQFRKLQPNDGGVIKGALARDFFLKSGLQVGVLSRIWHLSDLNKDHALDLDEFCIAMHLVVAVRHGVDLPQSLPALLLPKTDDSFAQSLSTTPNDVSSSENLNSDEKLQSPGWANFDSAGDTHDSEDAQYTTTSGRALPSSNQTTDETANLRGQPAAEPPGSQAPPVPSHGRHPPVSHSVSSGHAASSHSHFAKFGKKHSIEIARPRATGGLLNLMDLGPGQLLPPPGGKKGRPPPKRLMSLQGVPSSVTSPTSVAEPSFSSGQSDASDSEVVKSRSKTESSLDDVAVEAAGQDDRDIEESTEKQTDEDEKEEKEKKKEKTEGERKDSEAQIMLRRSSSRKSRPRSYTGDSRSSVELEHLPDSSGDFGNPPTPPPRAKKGHSRASSLDLNKLIGTKGGALFDEPLTKEDKVKRDLSPPKKPPRTSIYKDHSPDREKSTTEVGNKPSQDTTSKSIIRPRPAPKAGKKGNLNHRRSASLDWGKDNASLPPPKAFDGTGPKIYPKRVAPNPPQLKNRAKSVDRNLSPRTVTTPEETERIRQQIPSAKPLEKKMRKHEVQARIRLLREKNSSLASINNELNQELREVMENRTSLELKTEKLKQSFNK